MNKKNYVIEINRFIAILVIMGHHLYRIKAVDYPFKLGWVYVEFFFLVTGYFSAKHLSKNTVYSGFDYTIEKFKRYIILTWIAIIAEYVLEICIAYFKYNVKDIYIYGDILKNLPFEFLLVGSSYTTPHLVPIWYLSALFIVFPIFCLFFQIKNAQVRCVFELLLPLIFYGYAGIADNWKFPMNLFRTLSGLLLGALVFDLGPKITKYLDKHFSNLLYKLIQLLCFILPIFVCWYGNQSLLRIVILCFIIGIFITSTGRGFTLNNKMYVLLGEASMPIFLFHWIVATFIGEFLYFINQNSRIAIYYSVSVVCGLLIVIIKRFIIEHRDSFRCK